MLWSSAFVDKDLIILSARYLLLALFINESDKGKEAPLAPAHALFFAYTQQLVCIFHFAIYIISLLKTF